MYIQKVNLRENFSCYLTLWFKYNTNGEFDPGSGRTLATCLRNASRTMTGASAP